MSSARFLKPIAVRAGDGEEGGASPSPRRTRPVLSFLTGLAPVTMRSTSFVSGSARCSSSDPTSSSSIDLLTIGADPQFDVAPRLIPVLSTAIPAPICVDPGSAGPNCPRIGRGSGVMVARGAAASESPRSSPCGLPLGPPLRPTHRAGESEGTRFLTSRSSSLSARGTRRSRRWEPSSPSRVAPGYASTNFDSAKSFGGLRAAAAPARPGSHRRARPRILPLQAVDCPELQRWGMRGGCRDH